MLSADERLRVVDLLAGAIADDPRAVLILALPEPLRPGLAANGNSRVLLLNALDLCEGDGHRAAPPSLAVLIEHLAVYAINHRDELRVLAVRLRVPPPPPADPFADQMIRGDLLFLDRHPLRNAIRNFLAPGAPRPILVVNGPEFCGKSRAGFLVEHLQGHPPGIKFCRVKFEKNAERPNVRDVARDLMVKLGGKATDLPEQNTNDKRWPRDLAIAVWTQLTEASAGWQGAWVIILDGLNASKLDAPLGDFVLQIAENMAGANLQRHRLLLIDFDTAALASLAEHWRPVHLEELGAQLAYTELEKLLTARGRADAPQLIAAVFKNLALPANDLRAFGGACELMLASLEAVE